MAIIEGFRVQNFRTLRDVSLGKRLSRCAMSMHIEIVVEDASGAKLLAALLPKLLGQQGDPHRWRVLDRYVQDSLCNTWELLADAVYPGGSAKIKKTGWPLSGQVKCQWAEKIGPLFDPDRNLSPSFTKLRDGLRRLVGS